MRIDSVRTDDGRLPVYAWPGGYPLAYLLADGETLCPGCANGENHAEPIFEPTDCPDDTQWTVVDVFAHFEGPALICAHCGVGTESAYGDPDADEEGASDA